MEREVIYPFEYSPIGKMKGKSNIVAVLSTTVLPLDGTYQVDTLISADIKDIPHYIGHPTTKTIVERLGAIAAENKLFKGLEIGEAAVCFSIKQGRSTRKNEGFTVHQDVNFDDLEIRIVKRLEA